MGIAPRWQFNSQFALEGRIRGGFGLGSTSSVNPAFVYSPSKNLSLTLGYAWQTQTFSGKGDRYSGTTATVTTSDIKLSYNGPAVSVRMTF